MEGIEMKKSLLDELQEDIIKTKSYAETLKTKSDIVCKYFEIFYEYAKKIINSELILTGDGIEKVHIKPMEIEFYVFYCGVFEDPFVHRDPMQRNKGILYVHKMSEKYAGVDITFGDMKSCIYGGILLKSAEVNEKYCCGQTKVLEEILRLLQFKNSQKDNIAGKKFHHLAQEYLNKFKINIIENINYTEKNIRYSRRIGLSSRTKDNKDTGISLFKQAPYRFVDGELVEINKIDNLCKTLYSDEKYKKDSKCKFGYLTDLCYLKYFIEIGKIYLPNDFDEFNTNANLYKLKGPRNIFDGYRKFLEKYGKYMEGIS